MAATQQLLQTHDIPFSVQGYVTDPKMVGYQILTNYESTYWRALVGNDAWGLYEVLRSFCHEGNTTCYPSINLLLNILNLKQRRVLTGWVTSVKGKEYRYPGLIEILQENKLIVAEVQGEGPKMRYVFHVDMTPGLLSDYQLSQLPNVLQKKHAELLERCEQALKKMESKRRPPKVKMKPQKGASGGSDNLSEGYDKLYGGSDKLSPEQQQYNNTQLTSASSRKESNNNSGGESERKDSVVVALIDHGISEKVAKRLTRHYSAERVLQKIEYLDYLVAETPDKVQKPNGWLRRAIEEDYGAPDGYLSRAERERLAAAEARQAEEERRLAEIEEDQKRSLQEEMQAERAARVRKLHEKYGTAEDDITFWEKAKRELQYTATSDINPLLAELEVLQISDVTVTLGAWTEAAWRRLQHPGTAKIFARALSRVAEQPLEVETVSLAEKLKNQR